MTWFNSAQIAYGAYFLSAMFVLASVLTMQRQTRKASALHTIKARRREHFVDSYCEKEMYENGHKQYWLNFSYNQDEKVTRVRKKKKRSQEPKSQFVFLTNVARAVQN